MPGEHDDGDDLSVYEETPLTTKTKIEIGRAWQLIDGGTEDPTAIETALGPELNPPRWSDKLSRKILHFAHANADFNEVKALLQAEVQQRNEPYISHASAKAAFDRVGYQTPNPGKPKKNMATSVQTRSARRAVNNSQPRNRGSVTASGLKVWKAAVERRRATLDSTPVPGPTITVATSPSPPLVTPASSPLVPTSQLPNTQTSPSITFNSSPPPVSVRPFSSFLAAESRSPSRSPPVDPRLSSAREAAPPDVDPLDRLALLAHATTMTRSTRNINRTSNANFSPSSTQTPTPATSHLKRAIEEINSQYQHESKRRRLEINSVQTQVDDLDFKADVIDQEVKDLDSRLKSEESRLEEINSVISKREDDVRTVVAELEQLTTRFPELFRQASSEGVNSSGVGHAATLDLLIESLRAQGISDAEKRRSAEQSVHELRGELQTKEREKTELYLKSSELVAQLAEHRRQVDRYEAALEANLAVLAA